MIFENKSFNYIRNNNRINFRYCIITYIIIAAKRITNKPIDNFIQFIQNSGKSFIISITITTISSAMIDKLLSSILLTIAIKYIHFLKNENNYHSIFRYVRSKKTLFDEYFYPLNFKQRMFKLFFFAKWMPYRLIFFLVKQYIRFFKT